MKLGILIILLFFLFPLSLNGQEAIEASVLYNKTKTTLTVEIKNYSDKVITVKNQSRYVDTAASFIELNFRGKDGKLSYYLVPLGDESTGFLWKDFTELQPLRIRTCVYSASIDEYSKFGELIAASMRVSYFYKDGAENLVRQLYEKNTNFRS